MKDEKEELTAEQIAQIELEKEIQEQIDKEEQEFKDKKSDSGSSNPPNNKSGDAPSGNNKPIRVFVTRLSENQGRLGSHSYLVDKGLSAEDLSRCAMYGRDERENRVFYSPKEVGSVGKSIEMDLLMIPIRSGKNAGQMQLVFKRTDAEKKEQSEREAIARELSKEARAYGLTKQNVGDHVISALASQNAKHVFAKFGRKSADDSATDAKP